MPTFDERSITFERFWISFIPIDNLAGWAKNGETIQKGGFGSHPTAGWVEANGELEVALGLFLEISKEAVGWDVFVHLIPANQSQDFCACRVSCEHLRLAWPGERQEG